MPKTYLVDTFPAFFVVDWRKISKKSELKNKNQ